MRLKIYKGRGATSQIPGRFEHMTREVVDDGWSSSVDASAPLLTTVAIDTAKTVIQRNSSPDLPFEYSLNPYRGCEHGCIYCYARPSHAYLNLSPGLDFEARLFAKPNAANLLRAELSNPSYRCSPIALGTNTDPYQPIEREWSITRNILEVMEEARHPVCIITKSALVERDLDLLVALARNKLVEVFISITTLDPGKARRLEPRASSPNRRLQALNKLSQAGIRCGVMVAPVIPVLTDSELEQVLQAAREHGARKAGYTLLRLPYEVSPMFQDWLAENFPLAAGHVMNRMREMRCGRENGTEFHGRFRGEGVLADLLEKRFRIACARTGLNVGESSLDVSQFRHPVRHGQMPLF
jgi:DNA repair photolyase